MEKFYNDIGHYYSLNDDLLETIERADPDEQELCCDLAAPLMEAVTEGAEIFADNYIRFVEADGDLRRVNQKAVDSSVRKIFNAVLGVISKLQNMPSEHAGVLPAEIPSDLGPNETNLLKQRSRHPSLVGFIDAVLAIGSHTKRVIVAFLEHTRMITSREMIEPGHIQEQRAGISIQDRIKEAEKAYNF